MSVHKTDKLSSLLLKVLRDSVGRFSLPLTAHLTLSFVSACPYLILSAGCGHTFCAQCILKWYFVSMHTCCGTWHDPVTCPLCRSVLITPDEPPREKNTFPFAPNRAVADSINSIFAHFDTIFPRPKRKQRRSSKKPRPSVCKIGNGAAQVKTEGSFDHIGEAKVETWLQGGKQRTDWAQRDS